ncbi:protein RESISTANCE TO PHYTOPHTHORA 1, chloroplastic isoform X2 [Phoenix dactylifera]|uniref:Protein RESISTANCE TO PHYTOPHTHORA 1, chloroplastic isoform X2 n=1 Tax=Phoenix dactylifera TaxID=42345 RepID=A0A8B9APF6_PHODC|nr:protein RESISTANCE TO PHYTOPHTHORA 1, chloroplastic isoform X2 [Phoenix dactylifera]
MRMLKAFHFSSCSSSPPLKIRERKKMYSLYSAAPCSPRISKFSIIFPTLKTSSYDAGFGRRTRVRAEARSDGLDTPTVQESSEQQEAGSSSNSSKSKPPPLPSAAPDIDKKIKKVAQKTAATFAPRASTATKNPAVPGTALYTLFEVQGYASMLFGGALSFNLIFPSNEPDIWRLMGMWSVWMFTIPSLRARDCSKNEKEALNYLFLLIPLLNVVIPFFWKSFSIVWSADTITFFVMYAWKLGWLQRSE